MNRSVTGHVPVPGDCLAGPGSDGAGIPNMYRLLTGVTGCMSICHDIMLLIGVCADHGIHGNNCEVSAHIPPSYIVNM